MNALTRAIGRGIRRARQWLAGDAKPAQWRLAYGGKPAWDIGRPQRAIVRAATRITGSVLDVGCGTGENALYLAKLGRKTTGVDFVGDAIEQARQKALRRGLAACFRVGDALALERLNEQFDNAVDSGLFHILTPERQRRYVQSLAAALREGGRLFLLGFSDEEPLTDSKVATRPMRITQDHLRDVFRRGWVIESIERETFELSGHLSSKNGGARAWFAVIRRQGDAGK